MTAEDQLEAQLRKAFNIYLTEINNILHVLASPTVGSVLYSLVNQVDQLLCCQRCQLEETPLSAFPDLPGRLSYRISSQVDGMVDKLRTALGQVETSHSKMLTQQKLVMERYEASWQQQTVGSAARGTPARPAVSQLLEWLSDLEQDAFFILVEKRQLLQQLDVSREQTVQRLRDTWPADHGLSDKLTHVEAYLQFFLENDS